MNKYWTLCGTFDKLYKLLANMQVHKASKWPRITLKKKTKTSSVTFQYDYCRTKE